MWNLKYTVECASESHSVVSDSLQSHGLYSLLNSPGQNTGVGRVAFPFSRGSSQPRSPVLQVDSLPAEPQGKPKNTEVGSLSLLQGIFLTQESNWGFLHCRQILNQLSYQGSPQIYPYEICPWWEINERKLFVTIWFIYFRMQILDSPHRPPTFVTQACLLAPLVAKESKHSKVLRWSKAATLWIPTKEADIRPWNLLREWWTLADTHTVTGTTSPNLGSAK